MSAKRIDPWVTASSYTRDFGVNQQVYVFFSHRIRGLGIGVDLNPDDGCGADCRSCLNCRNGNSQELISLAEELTQTLTLVFSGQLKERPPYRTLPPELLRLQGVVLNIDPSHRIPGDLLDRVETIQCVRARAGFPFFKFILQADARSLAQPEVRQAVRRLTLRDEVWLRLDGGTEAYLTLVGQAQGSPKQILANVLTLAQERPVILQSLFPVINGQEPPVSEIEAYIHRLEELKQAGARIPLVQISSATPNQAGTRYDHLPLSKLSAIARRVQQVSGLKTEIC